MSTTRGMEGEGKEFGEGFVSTARRGLRLKLIMAYHQGSVPSRLGYEQYLYLPLHPCRLCVAGRSTSTLMLGGSSVALTH
jgi:hypothetical protein